MPAPDQVKPRKSREWYYIDDARQEGPVSTSELKKLAACGTIRPDTYIWESGLPDWILAEKVNGLFPEQKSRPSEPRETTASTTTPVSGPNGGDINPAIAQFTETARQSVHHWIDNIRRADLWQRATLWQPESWRSILADSTFWVIAVFGIAPLLIGTLRESAHQIHVFAIYFAMFWAFVFVKFIVRPQRSRWLMWLGALFFTGLIGIWGLLLCYRIVPSFIVSSPMSETAAIRLVGSVFVTGISEEFCKSLPVIAYVLIAFRSVNRQTAILLGVFSGLGFAAFENVGYNDSAIVKSAVLTSEYGVEGLAAGVRSAMVLAMLRSVSLVFCHALWAGIVAFFCAQIAGSRWTLAFFLPVGIGVAALLHGSYNWLQSIQPTFATLIVLISFGVFFLFIKQPEAEPQQELGT